MSLSPTPESNELKSTFLLIKVIPEICPTNDNLV